MSTFKNLTTSAFKDTIKMTLTTDGNMGVGNINPNYKITASGTIQGASNGTQVTINTVPLRVGLDTWKDNVHLSLGQIDLTNQGFIQVLVGAYNNGIDINGTGYGLSIQPSGGNVGIGQQAAGSKLQVNGTIRTDDDFVTGTDLPGWNYTFIPEPWFYAISNSGAIQYPGIKWNTDPDRNPFDRAHYSWKIIGKTCFLHLNFSTLGSGHGLNTYGYIVLLPQEFQPGGIYSIKNFYLPNPGSTTTHTPSTDSIGWVNTAANRYAMSFSLRRVTSFPYLDRYCAVIETMYKNGSGTPGTYGPDHYQNATFRFQTVFELD